jgi:hypothetical protein
MEMERDQEDIGKFGGNHEIIEIKSGERVWEGEYSSNTVYTYL